MQVEFRDSTPPAEVPQLFYQLRKKLGDIRSDLPSTHLLNVNDEYGDVDFILYMLTADSGDYAQMKRVAEMMRQKLLKVENVTKVNLYGVQDEKIFVEFSHAKLATLGISPQAIFASLAKQNAVTGRHRRNQRSGVVDTIREAGKVAHVGYPDHRVDGLTKPALYVTGEDPLANTSAQIRVEHVFRDIAARNDLDI